MPKSAPAWGAVRRSGVEAVGEIRKGDVPREQEHLKGRRATDALGTRDETGEAHARLSDVNANAKTNLGFNMSSSILCPHPAKLPTNPN